MMDVGPAPTSTAPAAASPAAVFHTLALPLTAVTFRDRHGTLHPLETSSSVVLFARLHECAVEGGHVIEFVQDGRALTAESLAALNCYLRSVRIGRCGLPWHRVHILRSKYDWRDFAAHLELAFEAEK